MSGGLAQISNEDLPAVWVVTVCEICAANVYTVNLEPHLAWHQSNDRSQ